MAAIILETWFEDAPGIGWFVGMPRCSRVLLTICLTRLWKSLFVTTSSKGSEEPNCLVNVGFTKPDFLAAVGLDTSPPAV